jgi:hypothetical protein
MATASRNVGGLAPHKEIDKDKSERFEPRNTREADRLDAILAHHLKQSPGMYVMNKTYYAGARSEMRSSFDITFDRFYPGIDLCVQNFSRHRLYEDMNDDSFNQEYALYADYCEGAKLQFLAVIDGDVDPEHLARITIPRRGNVIPNEQNRGDESILEAHIKDGAGV